MRVRETAVLLDGPTRLSLQPQGAASCSVQDSDPLLFGVVERQLFSCAL